MVDTQNEFTGSMKPAVSDYSDVQVPAKHKFSDAFESRKFDGKFVGKGEL